MLLSCLFTAIRALFARCVIALVLSGRCTVVQEVTLKWRLPGVTTRRDTNEDSYNSVTLQGVGAAAHERCVSMQQQIGAISSSSTFLAPESWATSHSLASLRIDREACNAEAEAMYLGAGVQSKSLTSLWLRTPNEATVVTTLDQVQDTVQGLTLKLMPPSDERIGYSEFQARRLRPFTAISKLSGLQHMTLDPWALDIGKNSRIAIPNSWSQLQSLQSIEIGSHYPGLQQLEMASLSFLPHVTALTLNYVLEMRSNVYGHELANGCRAYNLNQQQPGLRHLTLVGTSVFTLGAWSGCTTLRFLHLSDIPFSPELCRCAAHHLAVGVAASAHHSQFRACHSESPQKPVLQAWQTRRWHYNETQLCPETLPDYWMMFRASSQLGKVPAMQPCTPGISAWTPRGHVMCMLIITRSMLHHLNLNAGLW
jgi:hypothetical protein